MDRQSFVRLATILVADDVYPDNVESIIDRIVENILFIHQDEKTSIEIQASILSLIKIQLSIDEIELCVNNENKYIKIFSSDLSKYKLRNEILVDIKARSENNINYYITQFSNIVLENKIDEKQVRILILKFLYLVMVNNYSQFQKIADRSIRSAGEVDVSNMFSSTEKEIINKFLEWDNEEKNKLIYKIAAIGVEYCILTNKEYYEELRNISLKNTRLYLDTNIIYRALGLNGYKRQVRVIQFINKCQQTKQKLYISYYTYKEFEESAKYHCDDVRKHPSINPVVFREYTSEEDFINAYFTWKDKNPSFGADMFLLKIKKDFKDFVSEYKIEIEKEKLPVSHEVDEAISLYSSKIDAYKRNQKNLAEYYLDSSIPTKTVFDAQNIYYLERKRDELASKIEYLYFVSADHLLIDWDHLRANREPIVILPSHWLTIFLRFISRTADDYSSFSEFINLPRRFEVISNENLTVIMEGVNSVTNDPQMQETIIADLLKNKIDRILRSKKYEKIYNRTIEEAKRIKDQEMKKLKDEYEEIVKKQSSDGKRNNIIIQEKNGIIGIQKAQIEDIKEYFRQHFINDETKKWRYKGITIGLLMIIVDVLLICMEIWPNSFNAKWLAEIITWIDNIKSEAIKQLLYWINIGIIGGIFTYAATILKKYMFDKNAYEAFISRVEIPEKYK